MVLEGPKIRFNISRIAGEELFIPSISTSLLGDTSLHSIAWHSGVFSYVNFCEPSLFFKIVLYNKSSTFVDFVIDILNISNPTNLL